MPVRRFRSVEEMQGVVWLEPGSRELETAIRRNWETAKAIGLPHFPPGVYRHRSIEELNAQVERWHRDTSG